MDDCKAGGEPFKKRDGWSTVIPTRRNVVYLCAVMVLLYLTGSAALYLNSGAPINAETYRLVNPGMSLSDVVSLIGRSGNSQKEFALWLNNRSPSIDERNDLLNGPISRGARLFWYDDNGVLIIEFDQNDYVADKQILGIRVSTARQHLKRGLERLGF